MNSHISSRAQMASGRQALNPFMVEKTKKPKNSSGWSIGNHRCLQIKSGNGWRFLNRIYHGWQEIINQSVPEWIQMYSHFIQARDWSGKRRIAIGTLAHKPVFPQSRRIGNAECLSSTSLVDSQDDRRKPQKRPPTLIPISIFFCIKIPDPKFLLLFTHHPGSGGQLETNSRNVY